MLFFPLYILIKKKKKKFPLYSLIGPIGRARERSKVIALLGEETRAEKKKEKKSAGHMARVETGPAR
jgi:hypothetical protein